MYVITLLATLTTTIYPNTHGVGRVRFPDHKAPVSYSMQDPRDSYNGARDKLAFLYVGLARWRGPPEKVHDRFN